MSAMPDWLPFATESAHATLASVASPSYDAGMFPIDPYADLGLPEPDAFTDLHDHQGWTDAEPVLSLVQDRAVQEDEPSAVEVVEAVAQALIPAVPLGGTWDIPDYLAGGNSGSSAAKLADSVVAPLVAAARGYETLTDAKAMRKHPALPDARKTQGARFKRYVEGDGLLMMPWFTPKDNTLAERSKILARPSTLQVRPGTNQPEENDKGKPMKYEFSAGSHTPLGMHPAIPTSWINGSSTDVDDDRAKIVLLAEGLLKGDAALTAYLLAQGFTAGDLAWDGEGGTEAARQRLHGMLATIPVEARVLIMTIAGVDNWKKNPEWLAMNLRDVIVWLGLDGDVDSNGNVWRACNQAWEYLLDHHKAVPMLLAATGISTDGEVEKVGIDDYLAKYGDWTSLLSRLSDTMPDNPLSPALLDLMSRIGEERLEVDMTRGVTTRVKVEGIPNAFNPGGPPESAKEIRERVVDVAIEIAETNEVSNRLKPRAPKQISHTLRVKTPETPAVMVYDVSDEEIARPERIIRLAGAATLHAATWHETPSTALDREMGAAIRVTTAEDYATRRVQKQPGLLTIPAVDGPDAVEREHLIGQPANTDTMWSWVKDGMNGAIGPDHLATPDAASAAPEVGDREIPEYQDVRYLLNDIRTLLVDTMGAFNDPTAFYACMGRAGSCYAGARPRGGLYIWGKRQIGKSEMLRWWFGWAFGGEPPSVVNNSKGFVLSYAKSRSGVLTIADDRKRVAGDSADWPTKNLNASLFTRAAYDGPGALRNTQKQGEDGDWDIALAGKIYPTTILGGELAPDWDPSTLSKIMDVHCDDDFIKPGQAAKVLARQADEGLAMRLARGYIAWQCNEIPRRHLAGGTQSVDALENYWLSEFRKAHGVGDDKVPYGYAWEQMTDEQRAAATTWTERARDVLTGMLYGLVEMATWMRAVCDATPDIALGVETRDLVDAWLRDGLKAVFEAQDHWQAECASSEQIGAAGGMGVVAALRHGLAQKTAFIEGGLVENRFSNMVLIGKVSGKHTYQPDPRTDVKVTVETIDLDIAAVAQVADVDQATVKDALRSVALRNGQGKFGFQTTINGVQRSTMRVPWVEVYGAERPEVTVPKADDAF